MEIRAAGLRAYLRTLEEGDADELARIADDEEVALYAARPGEFPHPYKREDALALIGLAKKQYEEKSGFHFGIRLDAGMLIGACNVGRLDYRDMKGEVGFWLGKPYWGEGYAKDALELLLGFCFNKLRLNRAYASVLAFNGRALRLLASLGFVKEGVLRQNALVGDMFVDEIVLAMLKQDYGRGAGARATA